MKKRLLTDSDYWVGAGKLLGHDVINCKGRWWDYTGPFDLILNFNECRLEGYPKASFHGNYVQLPHGVAYFQPSWDDSQKKPTPLDWLSHIHVVCLDEPSNELREYLGRLWEAGYSVAAFGKKSWGHPMYMGDVPANKTNDVIVSSKVLLTSDPELSLYSWAQGVPSVSLESELTFEKALAMGQEDVESIQGFVQKDARSVRLKELLDAALGSV